MKITWNEVETDVPQSIVDTLDQVKIECRKKSDNTIVKILSTAHTFHNSGSGEGVLTLYLDIP